MPAETELLKWVVIWAITALFLLVRHWRSDAGAGLFVTSMFGPSLNPNTGDWSAGVSGFWFEDGEIAYPVNEITVAGNLIEMYGRVVAGSDLELRGASNSPSLLIDNLAIAGR